MQNIRDSLKGSEAKFGVGGGNDKFKFQKGPNKLRILAMSSEPLANHFMGKNKPSVVCVGVKEGCKLHGADAPTGADGKPLKVSIKYLVYALDRTDDRIKLIYMPYSVCKHIGEFQMEEGWEFDDMPMPYDINVKYDPDASPSQMYTTVPSPSRTQIPAEVIDELNSKKPLDSIVEKIKQKQVVDSAELGETEE